VFLESSFVFPSSSRLLLVRWVSALTSRRRNDGPWCRELSAATETALKLSENEVGETVGFYPEAQSVIWSRHEGLLKSQEES